jgi:tetratricopeptide (TPR) repeat protein
VARKGLLLLLSAGVAALLLWALGSRRLASNGKRTIALTRTSTPGPSFGAQRPEPRAQDRLALAEGDRLAQEGRWFAAIWAFQTALERQPGEFTARFSIASALLRARLFGAAAGEFRALLADHPESAEARVGLARAERAVGRPEKALAALAAASPPVSADLLIERGRAAQAAGLFDTARSAYRAILDREPDSVEGLYRLGRLLVADGKTMEAVSALRRARQLDPEDADVAWALGTALRRTGAGVDEVGETLTAAIRARPNHAPALLELASLCRSTGRSRQAAELLAQAIRADPSAAEPHRELSAVMTALGRPDDARYHRGLDFLTRDQPLQAIEVFRDMARRDPSAVEPVLMASLGYVKMRQNLPAAREVARALPRFPRNPELLERLAALYVLTHDHPLARKLCAQWRASYPDDPRPAWILGRIAANDGQSEEAVGLYEESLRRRPEFLDVKGDLARVLLELGGPERLARARTLLEEALARAPGLADLHLQLALTLQAEGKYAEALDRVFHALERNPGLIPGYTALLSLAPRLGAGQRAPFYGRLLRDARERAREEDQLWSSLWQDARNAARFRAMARHFLAVGDLRRAGYHLDSALALRPAWAAARTERALVRRLQEVE